LNKLLLRHSLECLSRKKRPVSCGCFPCKLYLFIYIATINRLKRTTSVSRVVLNKIARLVALVRCRSVAPSTCLLHMSPHACSSRQIYISYRTYTRPIRRMRFRKFSQQHVVKQPIYYTIYIRHQTCMHAHITP